MTWQEWAPYIKDAMMSSVLVLAWFMGRERRQIDKEIAELKERMDTLEERLWDDHARPRR